MGRSPPHRPMRPAPSSRLDAPAHPRPARRTGAFTAPTAGHAPGRAQANLAILPQAEAHDFLLFCQRNPGPLPLLEVLAAGTREARSAPGSDIATDAAG